VEKVQKEMISVSLLLNCRLGSPADSLSCLGIAPADIASYADASPEFLAVQRNGTLVSATSGDFTHAADVFLYEYKVEKLEADLMAMSLRGVDVAMPVSDDPDPEVYWYWHKGGRRMLRVVDIDGELQLVDPLAKHGMGSE
jgi:hypothetical protein